jgi:hypothetical protein
MGVRKLEITIINYAKRMNVQLWIKDSCEEIDELFGADFEEGLINMKNILEKQ